MTRLERISIFVAVFLAGGLLMSLEVAAFRIIGKTFGTALTETTAVIAVFLGAMSLGYWLGGRAGDRRPRSSTLSAMLLAAAATLLVVPWLDAFVSPRIAASDLDLSTHAFLATSLLFSVPTVLFAAVSPIAVRLMATTTVESGSTAGAVSAVSAAGSIAGSIITAFFLIDWLESIARTVLFVALGAAVIAVIVGASSQKLEGGRGRRPLTLALASLVVLIGLAILLYVRSSRLEEALLTPVGEWKTLFVGDSPYHRVTVRESRGARHLSFSLAAQSRMFVADPNGPGAVYTDALHLPRLMRPGVRRVLTIGLGGGTFAKQYTTYYPDTTVDAVEVDPMVVDVARRFFAVEPSNRLRIHVSDGRTFLKRSKETWDLIVIDAYTMNLYGDTVPAHLTTQEFFREAAAHLSVGGILMFHCAFAESKLLPALHRTIGSVFGSVLVTAGEIIASDVALLTSKETMVERARTPHLARLPNLPIFIEGLRPPPAGDALLLTDDFAPVDRLARAGR